MKTLILSILIFSIFAFPQNNLKEKSRITATDEQVPPMHSICIPTAPPNVYIGKAVRTASQIVISNVPSYIWYRGCGPTAVGMVVGYWDYTLYQDLIPGDPQSQTSNVDSAIANNSHYNDYSLPLDYNPNLLSDKSSLGGAHQSNCIADFMNTSWSSRNNYYGWSWSSDIGPAFVNYVKMKYPYSNPTRSTVGMSDTASAWELYKTEINNNRPVVLLVDSDGDGATDHFVAGIGYDSDNQYYGVYNTWDHLIHWLQWKKMQSGLSWGIYCFERLNIVSQKFIVTIATNPLEGGTTVGAGTYDNGQKATVVAIPNSSWYFINWTENGDVISTEASYTFTVTSDRNIMANFHKIRYTILLTSNPSNGGTTVGSGEYNSGDFAAVQASPFIGWNFINWTEDGNIVSTDSNYSFKVTSNRNISANFQRLKYTITVSSNPPDGGSTTGEGEYSYEDTAVINAVSAEGWSFINWTENDHAISADSVYSFAVTSDRNIAANFDKVDYEISVSSYPSYGGTTQGGGTFKYGDTVTVKAFPSAGWNFINWTEDTIIVSSDTNYSFAVTSNKVIIANFSKIRYTVSVLRNPSKGGIITGGGTFNYGDSATIKAYPAAGWQFVNWMENDDVVSTDTIYTFAVNSNRNFIANFSKIQYTISVSSHPPRGGITSGMGIYFYGDTLKLNAFPNPGWKFINWCENDLIVCESADYTCLINKSRNFIANFDSILSGVEILSMVKGKVAEYYMANNYPNPFNPQTSIEFGIPEESINTLKVFDITGSLVSVLLKNKTLPQGRFRYSFSGENLPSGIYIYVLTSRSVVSNKTFNAIKKMVLLK